MHPPSFCSAMEVTADDATVSYSSSSTEEYPYPYPYPYQHQHQSVTKRKRTVRPRAHSLPISAASSAASAYDETSSTTTTEEEDMAHCLILLARGRRSPPPPPPPPREKPSAGVYECKTCNKCFTSFQALGGHRASHKKPKTAGPLEAHRAQAQQAISTTNDVISIGEAAINYIEHGKMKIHECSTCGAEFSSGQALGGHMRRHRTVVAAPPESPETANKGRNFLPLDLNLPPASDEDSMSPVAFTFVERGPPLAFSTAPALVDCYY